MSIEASSSASSSSVPNVFRVPHSRMKELVDARLRQVDKIKEFTKQDREDLDTLLQVRNIWRR